ncbi:MAG: sialate O-acetylesterase [Bacteroidales bacterium]|nr:sialate O-acetylesterase [Bacteroidales bacterium]
MVLQQNSTFTISGEEKPPYRPVKINCSWEGESQYHTVEVSGDGRWSQEIDVPAASFVKHTVTVTAEGRKELVFSNILIGEVWLCSGQSNMWFPLIDAFNGITEINGADNYPDIRLLDMRRLQSSQPVDTFPARWQVCSKQSVRNFSAIGYFFGKKLLQELNVPIGLINASWGATTAEVWAERNAVLNNPQIKDVALINDNTPILQYPEVPYQIGSAYNAMIHPLGKIPIAGVIWYQGEGNVKYPDTYPDLLSTLVTSWRRLWNVPAEQLPFYIAQICPYKESTANHAMRFAQLKASKQIPNSGVTCNDDIADLDDIHPKNKQDAGIRFACLALADKYRRTDFNSKKSPVFKSYTVNGNKMTVEFSFADEGLKTRDNAAPAMFEIAGANRVFFPASATIVGNKVELTSSSVANPSAARLGWNHINITNLTSSSGLPVCIFKTYEW